MEITKAFAVALRSVRLLDNVLEVKACERESIVSEWAGLRSRVGSEVLYDWEIHEILQILFKSAFLFYSSQLLDAIRPHVEGIVVTLAQIDSSAVLRSLTTKLIPMAKDAAAMNDVSGQQFLFNNQTMSLDEIKAKCRGLLSSSMDYEYLEESDFDLLCGVLAYHPTKAKAAKLKKLIPIKSARIGAVSELLKAKASEPDPEMYREPEIQPVGIYAAPREDMEGRAFFIVWDDEEGSEDIEDFSYLKCCENMPSRVKECVGNFSNMLVLAADRMGHAEVANRYFISIKDNFPSAHQALSLHKLYFSFCLYVANKMPLIKEDLLRVAIAKLLDADMKLGGAYAGDDSEVGGGIVDVMMEKILGFIDCEFEDFDASQDKIPDIVRTVFDSFEQTVLKADSAKYVQFIAFYIASKKSEYAEALLTSFLRMVFNGEEISETSIKKRIRALMYIGSFVARSTFIGCRFVAKSCLYIMELCHDLQAVLSEEVPDGTRRLLQRLSVVALQTVCYVLCWNFASPEFFQIAGDDNILKFVKLCAEAPEFSMVNPQIIERLISALEVEGRVPELVSLCRQVKAQPVPADVEGLNISACTEVVSAFFPFDFYPPKISGRRFKDLYRDWGGPVPEDPEQKEDAKEQKALVEMPVKFVSEASSSGEDTSAHVGAWKTGRSPVRHSEEQLRVIEECRKEILALNEERKALKEGLMNEPTLFPSPVLISAQPPHCEGGMEEAEMTGLSLEDTRDSLEQYNDAESHFFFKIQENGENVETPVREDAVSFELEGRDCLLGSKERKKIRKREFSQLTDFDAFFPEYDIRVNEVPLYIESDFNQKEILQFQPSPIIGPRDPKWAHIPNQCAESFEPLFDPSAIALQTDSRRQATPKQRPASEANCVLQRLFASPAYKRGRLSLM